MPAPKRQQQDQRAVVVRQEGQRPESEGPQRALVAVTREIDSRLALVQAGAAAGIRPDRLKLVALTAFTRTPSLWTCEPVSVARAIVEAGQLGLEPTGLLGGAYLVPRGGQATLLVGYRGLVILAMRSHLVQRVEARVVRERDSFDYGYGLEPYLHHVPSRELDPGPFTAAYAIIFYRDGSRQFDVMSIAEIEAIRKRSSSPNAGPWVTDYAEMCKKTPLRRLMKLAPLTVEVAAKLDELDPEVIEGEARDVTPTRTTELRDQLQAALVREFGTAPGMTQGAATTHGAGAGTPSAQATATEGAHEAPSGAPQAQQEAAAPSAGAAAPAESKPEAVGSILAATCGTVHEGLGVGPCTLPAGHTERPWQDASGEEHRPQAEHEDANSNRWTMPKGK